MNHLITTPISWGELLDKIAILEIKQARIGDAGKRRNVTQELELLQAVRDQGLPQSLPEGFTALCDELKSINETLWVIEDDIRDCERAGDFGVRFVELARSVYIQNDRRAATKRSINLALGSTLVEEKSYQPY